MSKNGELNAMGKNKTLKNEWVEKMNARLLAAEEKNPMTVGVIAINDRAIVMDTTSVENPKIGAASFKDVSNDYDTATAIAYARMIGEKIPNYVLYNGTPFVELSVGDCFKFCGRNYIKITEYYAYCYELDNKFEVASDTKVQPDKN